jgi:hypothetical protein
MDPVMLDWSSAHVDDGRLEVPLSSEPAREWKASFEQTVALLSGGQWGKVKLKKHRVRVDDVEEGQESELHHFLEGVVLQANATCEENGDTDTGQDETAQDDRDVEMTARFRGFATAPDS